MKANVSYLCMGAAVFDEHNMVQVPEIMLGDYDKVGKPEKKGL